MYFQVDIFCQYGRNMREFCQRTPFFRRNAILFPNIMQLLGFFRGNAKVTNDLPLQLL